MSPLHWIRQQLRDRSGGVAPARPEVARVERLEDRRLMSIVTPHGVFSDGLPPGTLTGGTPTTTVSYVNVKHTYQGIATTTGVTATIVVSLTKETSAGKLGGTIWMQINGSLTLTGTLAGRMKDARHYVLNFTGTGDAAGVTGKFTGHTTVSGSKLVGTFNVTYPGGNASGPYTLKKKVKTSVA